MTSTSQLLGRGARGGQEVEKGRRADTDLPPLSHPGLLLRLFTDLFKFLEPLSCGQMYPYWLRNLMT